MKSPMDWLFALSTLTLTLHRDASAQPPETFVDWALEALKRHVHFDSALWGAGHATPEGVPVVHSQWLHRQPAQLMVDYAAIAPYDVVFAQSLQQPGVSVVADARDGRLAAFADYIDRYHIEHVLNTCDVDPLSGLLNDIALWRAERTRPFTEEERVFVQAAFPHLIAALTRHRLHHLSRHANASAIGIWHSAVADRTGVLHHAEGEFLQLLREAWPDWQGPRLPAVLAGRLAQDVRQQEAMPQLVIKFTPLHDLSLVQARRRVDFDLLTAREREIAAHTAQGMTHKDIARLLGLSPATVRNHLAHACRRLKVRTKAQLAALVQRYQ